ncbi:MAG: methyl-accepting chemotaxis protein [Kiloniellales bacterium]
MDHPQANTTPPSDRTPRERKPRLNLSHLSVARKMALIAALAVTLCFAAIVTISVSKARNDLVQQGERSFLTITELLANNVAGGLRWNKPEAVEKAYEAFAIAEGSAIASIRTFNKNGEILTRFDSETLQTYDLDGAVELGTQATSSTGVHLSRADDHVVVVVPAGADKEGKRHGTLAVAWSLSALQEQVYTAMIQQIGVAAAGLIGLIVLLTFTSTRMIGRPLALVTEAMAKLAAGDNSVEIPATEKRDDIGAMAQAVQVFKENAIEMERLRAEQSKAAERVQEEKRQAMLKLAGDFEDSVKGVVDAVSVSTTEMRSTAQSMSATAEQTNAQSTAVASASEQASANVQTVAAATEELSSSIAEIGRQVVESAAIAGDAASQAEQTNDTIQGLAEAAQKIGEVVELINDIAEQTNLLALNATIEAARAGEAGKGFAVVAGEVKSLASQTAEATEEIRNQIGTMQSVTGEAVSAIQSITGTIGKINEITTSISSAVEEQNAATDEISRNVQEAARGTQEVTRNIAGVTQAASETGSVANRVLSSTETMSEQVSALSEEVENFLKQVRAS